jgi:hypothetical protein
MTGVYTGSYVSLQVSGLYKDPAYENIRSNSSYVYDILVKEMVFDKAYPAAYLTRVGYKFLGWRLGLDSSESEQIRGIYKPGENIILDRDAIINLTVERSGYSFESYLYTDTSHSMINGTTQYSGNPHSTDLVYYGTYGDVDDYYRLGNIEELGDADSGYTFEFDASGNCIGITFPPANNTHYAQMFAVWEANVYEVEFNVNVNALAEAKRSMSNSEYNLLLQDYVCSVCIRIARDMFALLPIRNTIVHSVLDGKTILSVDFDRQSLSKVKFGYIDPSDTLQQFKHNMFFDEINGFLPVENIE